MNKVVFSVSKAGRSESKVSGVGYIDDKSLYIPSISKKGNALICIKICCRNSNKLSYRACSRNYDIVII